MVKKRSLNLFRQVMVRTFFCLLWCAPLMLLTACGTVKKNYQDIRARPNAYLQSESLPVLQVPPDIQHAPLLEDAHVPPGAVSKVKMSLLPPESLAEKVAAGKVSKKELKPLARTNLQQRNQQWILTFTDEKDRVWKKLAKAFKNRNIRVLRENEAESVYYIVDTFLTNNKVTLKSPIYQVHLRTGSEQNTEIYLLTNEGTLPNEHAAKRIMSDIQQGLEGHKNRDLTMIVKKIVTGQ